STGDPVRMVGIVTLVIGAGQLLAAAARLGRFGRFVSDPVLSGFTAGAGIYIAVNQLPTFLGIPRAGLGLTLFGWAPPRNCVFDLLRAATNIHRGHIVAFGVGFATFALIRVLQRLEPVLKRRLPAPFLAVAAVTFAAWALGLGDPSRGAAKLQLVRD